MAASYPKKPTLSKKIYIVKFLHSLADLYPCEVCGGHFKKLLAKYPIKNNSRKELVYYLCGLHNIVNKRLGKPHFDCKKAFDFWGGGCGCKAKKHGKNHKKIGKNRKKNSKKAIKKNKKEINKTIEKPKQHK